MDIQKFLKKLKVEIVGISKDVSEWIPALGTDEYISTNGIEYFNCGFSIKLEDITKVGDKILDKINQRNTTNYIEEDFVISGDCLEWIQIEDKDGIPLNTYEEEKNAEKCYYCHYRLIIRINGVQLTSEELQEIFPNTEVVD